LKERTRSSSGLPSPDAAKFFKKSEGEIAALLAESRKKLFDVRAKRPRHISTTKSSRRGTA
jgi:ribosomal protein L29